jgi:hypothetical protein
MSLQAIVDEYLARSASFYDAVVLAKLATLRSVRAQTACEVPSCGLGVI